MTLLTRPRALRTRLAIGGALAAMITLSACNSRDADTLQNSTMASEMLPPLPAALPMTEQSERVSYAPPVSRLPAARTLGYADPGDDGYAWIDRADTVFDVIGDAPPDYGFDYDDVEPWGWEAAGGYVTYAEPIDDGYYRYYYYEPGADDPYLVRDPWNSYGYSGGRIAAIYDAGGALLPWAVAGSRVDYGSRYYARGADLRRAALRGRRGVAAPVWAQRQPVIARAREQWVVARDTQPAWREWRQRDVARAARAQVREERQLRRDAAQRFAGWQQAGRRGAVPDLYGRTQRQADRRAERVAERQAERRQSVAAFARADFAAAQQRRRDTMQVRETPQRGFERAQFVQQQREMRQAQRQQRLAERQVRGADVQRQQRGAERAALRQQQLAQRAAQQRVDRRGAERAQLQAARAQQRAARQQQAAERRTGAGRQQMLAAREQQRAARQQQAAERRNAAGRQQMMAARAQQRAARQQQAAERRNAAGRQQMMAAREQQRAARQQQAAERRNAAGRQQMMAAREQQRAMRGQQAAARQQQMAQRQAQMAQRQQQGAQRQQQAAQQQQARQAQMAARQQQRVERQAQRGPGGSRGGRGKRD